MSSLDSIPLVRITGMRFHIAGTDEILRKACVVITDKETTDGDRPHKGGVDDLHMGTTDSKHACETCARGKQECLGHPGAFEFKYPVINPICIENVTRWLKIVCHGCSRIIVAPETYMKYPQRSRLAAAIAASNRVSGRNCHWCKSARVVVVRKSPTDKPTKITAKLGAMKYTLNPHMIETILNKMRDEDVMNILGSLESHPRNFIWRAMVIPPVTTRPAIRKANGSKSTNDDITQSLQVIIGANAIMPEVIPDEISDDLQRNIYNLNALLYSMVRGSANSGAAKSLAVALKGKHGEIREFLLGKRVFNVARSTIVGDHSIPINGLGVPLHFACVVEHEETVQPFNRARILGYVRNGKTKTYPAAVAVIKAETGVRYAIEYIDASDINDGDKILRNVIDGDIVLFNRQPTLTISNMSAHIVTVLRDPTSYPIRLNPAVCPLYNADFDGDAMNIIFATSESARAELYLLSLVNNWFTLYTTSGPSMGLSEDGIIGMALMTRDDTKFNREHAMRIFSRVRRLPDFTQAEYTGRELISLLLEQTPINLTRTAKIYDATKTAYIDYSPTEINVSIENGQLKSGVLDKATIGKGAVGGLFHVLSNEYNPQVALSCMHDMQAMTVGFLEQRGFSIGILDVLPSAEAQHKINNVISQTLEKARVLSNMYIEGKIVASFGETQESMYEKTLLNNVLKPGDSLAEIIMNDIDPRHNALFGLVSTGSKGTPHQMNNMMTSVGQKVMDNSRAPKKFGIGRTSAFAQRFSTEPIDGGYIANSFIMGLNNHEFLANAAASRFDLTLKALSTSVTGEQQRKSIKCLESLIVSSHGQIVKDGMIIELIAGDNFADTRFLENIRLPTIEMSDAKLAEYCPDPKWCAELKADRDLYRRNFTRIESLHRESTMGSVVRCLFNLDRIIINAVRTRDSVKPRAKLTPKELEASIAYVRNAIEDFPYIYMHPIQRARRTKIMPHHAAAAWMPQMIMRMRLRPNAIEENRLDVKILEIITNQIRLAILHGMLAPGTAIGIIAAQSFSEPFTQYMLDAHHRSAEGGSSFDSVNAVRALLGAKSVDNLSNPMMFIRLRAEYETDKAFVTAIANNIETITLQEFVSRYQVFFEHFGKPTHPDYTQEAELITQFVRLNPLYVPPVDLINYCIRFTINKQTLLIKNMTIEFLVTQLRKKYPNMYFMYTPENAPEVIIRVYMRAITVKTINLPNVRQILDQLIKTMVRGVDGITATKVISITRSVPAPDGSIERKKLWAIATRGTNFVGVLKVKEVEPTLVLTDSVQEIASVIGIVAARQQIINIMKDLIPSSELINWSHFMVYADEMTSTGKVTAIEQQGADARDAENIYLRMGFTAPLAKIIEAGVGAVTAPISGITPSLMVGQLPKLGTNYNKYIVDVACVQKNVKSASAIIDSVFS